MPEGDALHRAARRLQVLVGEQVEVEARHPRALATGVAPKLDGRRLLSVEAIGKNLLFRFEGGHVLRSHLRMSGSWSVVDRSADVPGLPWLLVRGETKQAVLRGGAVLELTDRRTRNLGPDILERPPRLDAIVGRFRAADQGRELGEALLDQRLVAGIGNLWRAEALWYARLSPWLRLHEVTDDELRAVLDEAARLMRRRLDGGRGGAVVYRRTGRPCSRCGETIRSHGQGDDNRIAYWCPGCQRGRVEARRGGGGTVTA
jgi:endonuclease-8